MYVCLHWTSRHSHFAGQTVRPIGRAAWPHELLVLAIQCDLSPRRSGACIMFFYLINCLILEKQKSVTIIFICIISGNVIRSTSSKTRIELTYLKNTRSATLGTPFYTACLPNVKPPSPPVRITPPPNPRRDKNVLCSLVSPWVSLFCFVSMLVIT